MHYQYQNSINFPPFVTFHWTRTDKQIHTHKKREKLINHTISITHTCKHQCGWKWGFTVIIFYNKWKIVFQRTAKSVSYKHLTHTWLNPIKNIYTCSNTNGTGTAQTQMQFTLNCYLTHSEVHLHFLIKST